MELMEERRKITQEKIYDKDGILTYTIIPNYKLKEEFLTNNETKLLKALIQVVQDIKKQYNINLQIFSQVALNQIIKINNTREKELYEYIKNKSIDFALYDIETNNIYCCIELDDKTHETKERIQRDLIVNRIFKNLNLKLIHIKTQKYYDQEEIKKLILEKI